MTAKHIRYIMIIAFIALIIIVLASCTSNTRAKNWGGNANIDLPQGKKLVTITWKENQLWYLMRDMKADEQAESYSFHEESSWGLIEGTVIINENK